jgi:hypothetical protein
MSICQCGHEKEEHKNNIGYYCCEGIAEDQGANIGCYCTKYQEREEHVVPQLL